ncbi:MULTISPECIES: ABC transporter ATP-binding protein [unclassified Mycolicibacterium]|uniref:ABC transporter ATP-binding protein n=1 Tax=unclassified Mycolicibacterium TaxID=2636767 RepID=UPI001390D837|nr:MULTISPECIES: ABC transporter ATP-binding protein [unclassified Mycolicibacterium]
MSGPTTGRIVAEISDLHVHFPIRHGRQRLLARAVDGVDLTIHEREIVALVGESGCGKTTIARTIMRLEDATSGSISVAGVDITHVGGRQLRTMRRDFQMIFQDPFESLPANSTAFDVVAEGLAIHHRQLDAPARREAAIAALAACGLPEAVTGRRMFELSGGQRQRVAIASAVAVEPRLLVADEPVSMLDVSLRAGILRVLLDLRERLGIATLFITHDLALAGVFADRVAVLYLGCVVEQGTGAEVIANPAHPYTRALVEVMPKPGGRRGPRALLSGEPPNPTERVTGCRFAARCSLFRALGSPERCTTEPPALRSIGADHAVACHFWDAMAHSTAKEKIV